MWRAVNAVLASVVALVLLSQFRTVPLVVSPRLVLVRPVPAGPAPAGTPPPGGLRIAPVATRQPGSGLAESPGRKVANRAGRYAGTDSGVVGSAALSRGADAGTAGSTGPSTISAVSSMPGGPVPSTGSGGPSGAGSAAAGSGAPPGSAGSAAQSGSAGSAGSAAGTIVLTGPAMPTPGGPVQVQVTIKDGVITDVQALQLPAAFVLSHALSDVVAPILRAEVLKAQDAQIDTVSGATLTSKAYARSLQAALDRARA